MTRTKNDLYIAYGFLLPALLVYVVFLLYPFLSGIVISLYRWNGVSPRHFQGIGNYVRLAADPRFLASLWHNVLYALGSVTGKIILGFIFALLLNARIRGMTVYRTLYFTPVVMSFVAVGLLWRWIYNPVFGLFDYLLQTIGFTHKSVGWLSNPQIALWSVVLADTWKWTGYHTVIFLAGLQTIPHELYEAAEVDGASFSGGSSASRCPASGNIDHQHHNCSHGRLQCLRSCLCDHGGRPLQFLRGDSHVHVSPYIQAAGARVWDGNGRGAVRDRDTDLAVAATLHEERL